MALQDDLIRLQKRLGLPDLLSAASLLEVLNTMMTRQELQQLLADET